MLSVLSAILYVEWLSSLNWRLEKCVWTSELNVTKGLCYLCMTTVTYYGICLTSTVLSKRFQNSQPWLGRVLPPALGLYQVTQLVKRELSFSWLFSPVRTRQSPIGQWIECTLRSVIPKNIRVIRLFTVYTTSCLYTVRMYCTVRHSHAAFDLSPDWSLRTDKWQPCSVYMCMNHWMQTTAEWLANCQLLSGDWWRESVIHGLLVLKYSTVLTFMRSMGTLWTRCCLCTNCIG